MKKVLKSKFAKTDIHQSTMQTKERVVPKNSLLEGLQSEDAAERRIAHEMFLRNCFRLIGVNLKNRRSFKDETPYTKYLVRICRYKLTKQNFELSRLNKFNSHLDSLEKDIRDGFLGRLQELTYIAHRSTKLLNEIATECPYFVGLIARRYTDWPILTTCSETKYPTSFEFLQSIELESDLPKGIRTAKLKTKPTCATKYAIDLIEIINQERLRPIFNLACKPISSRPIHQKLHAEAPLLPPFSKRSAHQWWNLANDLFIELTDSRPWEYPGLKNYANSEETRYASKDQKLDGIKRRNIKKHVKQAFMTLAPSENNSPENLEDMLLPLA
jgi:hypothetical protein